MADVVIYGTEYVPKSKFDQAQRDLRQYREAFVIKDRREVVEKLIRDHTVENLLAETKGLKALLLEALPWIEDCHASSVRAAQLRKRIEDAVKNPQF